MQASAKQFAGSIGDTGKPAIITCTPTNRADVIRDAVDAIGWIRRAEMVGIMPAGDYTDGMFRRLREVIAYGDVFREELTLRREVDLDQELEGPLGAAS